MALSPRESGKLIASLAKNVFIEEEGVKELASSLLEKLIEASRSGNASFGLDGDFSQYEMHPSPDDPGAVDRIFLLDTLNFSFWSQDPQKKWRVNGQTGYLALCAAIKRAVDNKIPIADPNYYANMKKEDLENIFRGDEGSVPVPMIDERLSNLHQVGRILIDKYNGTFVDFVKPCNGSAKTLLKKVVEEFECFRDEADFYGHRVSFYKRAQILVGDLWACFRGKGIGYFKDIDDMTMFADYRIPQVLMSFGAMRYSNPLMSTLSKGTELAPGSLEEIEIRGCSIEVVERVVEVVRAEIKAYSLNIDVTRCNAVRVDHYLWDWRRKHVEAMDKFPFHKVRTIYY